MGAQTWIYVLIGYFTFFGLAIGTLGEAGMLDPSINIQTSGILNRDTGDENATSPSASEPWAEKGFMEKAKAFFLFGIDLGINPMWMWVVRTVFVFLPLIMFGGAIYFSMPFVEGG